TAPAAPINGTTAPPKPAILSLKNAVVQGDVRAKVVLVEFLDYECSFCRKYFMSVFGDIHREYIATGKIRFAAFDYPLDVHKTATRRSQWAICANEQNQYWPAQSRLFAVQELLSDSAIAQQLQISSKEFGECVNSPRTQERLQENMRAGRELDVRGTPDFFIGLISEKNPMSITI